MEGDHYRQQQMSSSSSHNHFAPRSPLQPLQPPINPNRGLRTMFSRILHLPRNQPLAHSSEGTMPNHSSRGDTGDQESQTQNASLESRLEALEKISAENRGCTLRRLTSLELAIVHLSSSIDTRTPEHEFLNLSDELYLPPHVLKKSLRHLQKYVESSTDTASSQQTSSAMASPNIHQESSQDHISPNMMEDLVASNREVDDQIEEINKVMEELDTKIDEHRRKTAKKFHTASVRNGAVDRYLESVNQELDELDERAKQLEQRMDNVHSAHDIMIRDNNQNTQISKTHMEGVNLIMDHYNKRIDFMALQSKSALEQAESITKHAKVLTDSINRQNGIMGFIATHNVNARTNVEELREEVHTMGVRLQRVTNDPQRVILPRNASRTTRHNLMHSGINRELRAGVNRMLAHDVRRRRMRLRFRTPNIPHL